MARPRSVTALFAAVAALFGCDEGPASNLSLTSTPDVWSFVTATGSTGPILVDVRGNPFSAPDATVAGDVAAAIAGTFTEPWLKFTTDPEGAASRETRLIWLLDPQSGFNADLVCTGELPALNAGRRVTEIRAVFCHRGRPLSAVHGWVRKPERIDDPKWRQLISQMARQLLTGRG
jgi:hypothetical protein